MPLSAGVLTNQSNVKFSTAFRSAQRLSDLAVAQAARRGSQCCQVFAATVCRDQKKEHEVRRLRIDRGKVDRTLQASEQTEDALKALDPCMRDGDTFPDSGGTQLLTRIERVQNDVRGDSKHLACATRQLTEQLCFIRDVQVCNHTIRPDQIAEFHRLAPFN